MNKIFLVIQREYITRVKKKSFLIMTILGPLLMGGLVIGLSLINKVDTEIKTIAIVDETRAFYSIFKDSDRIRFENIQKPLDMVKSESKSKGYFGILFIPGTSNIVGLEKAVTFYSESQPGFEVISKIKFALEKEINTQKYIDAGIDEKKMNEIKTDVRIQTRDLEDKETSTPVTTYVGFASGILIYIFILIYGTTVMRGVMEEKTNRIVEVIISSIKPFQLMMGKIVGVALVGLTQFVLWILLTMVVVTGIGSFMNLESSGKSEIESVVSNRGMQPMMDAYHSEAAASQIGDIFETVQVTKIIIMFLFYFLGGYLLYSALFAAIGAAVDVETDTQQFMLPITIPLIIAYVAAISVVQNPQGNIAFWFSIIPFTSPIVMMVRLPFGVAWPELALSMALLIVGFIFTTWLAGKIYRTGILMYGKKSSYREIWKWIRYHN